MATVIKTTEDTQLAAHFVCMSCQGEFVYGPGFPDYCPQGNDGRMRATAERKANMKSGTTASPSQGAREIAEKLATHPNGEVEPFFTRRTLIAEAANLIDAELAEVRKAFANMIGWANYGEEADPWFFSKDQAPRYREEIKDAAALLERFTPGK